MVAVLPPATAFACHPDPAYGISAGCLAMLLAGGLRSLGTRHLAQSRQSEESSACAALARRDHLTGAMNRFALLEAIALRGQNGEAANGYALHYLDLDGFKQINDELGHAAGDALLRAVAQRLTASSSRGDIVARFGGDEFVVLQAPVSSPEEVAARADDLRQALCPPYRLAERAVSVGASVGSSRLSRRADEVSALLEEADMALRLRKSARRWQPPSDGGGTSQALLRA
jgi:diguanylate cyclase